MGHILSRRLPAPHLGCHLAARQSLATKIIGQIGDISRFPSADHLASYAGTGPIEASSGSVVRHRLSRGGNRKLNNAIHLAAHVQTLQPGRGQIYFEHRLAAGDSRKEALRELKRQITKVIYRTMRADLAGLSAAAA